MVWVVEGNTDSGSEQGVLGLLAVPGLVVSGEGMPGSPLAFEVGWIGAGPFTVVGEITCNATLGHRYSQCASREADAEPGAAAVVVAERRSCTGERPVRPARGAGPRLSPSSKPVVFR